MIEKQIKDSRKDWRVSTWADGYGIWHCRIESSGGWGNTGVRNMDNHFNALRERARYHIRREIQMRQGEQNFPLSVTVVKADPAPNNVVYSITFSES